MEYNRKNAQNPYSENIEYTPEKRSRLPKKQKVTFPLVVFVTLLAVVFATSLYYVLFTLLS